MTPKQEAHLEQNEQRLFDFMGLGYPYKRPKSSFSSKSDASKIVCLSDLHEPYGCFPVFQEVEKHHKDAETLICPGDVGDYYSKSRFRKTRIVSFAQEVRSIFLRLEWMATHFRQSFVMLGNHDNRPEKKIADIFDDGGIDLQILTEQNLLKKLASYFDNVTVVETPLAHSEIVLTHVWQYGDIVFLHAEKSQAQKSALLGTLSLQLFRWGETWGLKPYSVIAQGHNHTGAKMTIGRETWFLLPAAADPRKIGLEYIHSTRMQGDPPCMGYNIFYQENGKTDVNRSNYFVVKHG